MEGWDGISQFPSHAAVLMVNIHRQGVDLYTNSPLDGSFSFFSSTFWEMSKFGRCMLWAIVNSYFFRNFMSNFAIFDHALNFTAETQLPNRSLNTFPVLQKKRNDETTILDDFRNIPCSTVSSFLSDQYDFSASLLEDGICPASLPGSISSLVVRQTYICMLNVQ